MRKPSGDAVLRLREVEHEHDDETGALIDVKTAGKPAVTLVEMSGAHWWDERSHLHHVGHVVRDLRAALELYGPLGFAHSTARS
jgi:hypothetical protein